MRGDCAFCCNPDIDVYYVNVNAFYFTSILAEIDVTYIFYVLPCSYSQKGCFLLVRRSASVDLEIPVISTALAAAAI